MTPKKRYYVEEAGNPKSGSAIVYGLMTVLNIFAGFFVLALVPLLCAFNFIGAGVCLVVFMQDIMYEETIRRPVKEEEAKS